MKCLAGESGGGGVILGAPISYFKFLPVSSCLYRISFIEDNGALGGDTSSFCNLLLQKIHE